MPEHRAPTMADLEYERDRADAAEEELHTVIRQRDQAIAALLVATADIRPPGGDALDQVVRGLQAERYAPRHRAEA